jgi:hypothetical protein
LTHAPNGNNSLSPFKRGEGWGEGFELINISLLTPGPLLLEEGEGEKMVQCAVAPFSTQTAIFSSLFTSLGFTPSVFFLKCTCD